MLENLCGYLSERPAFLLALWLYAFRLSQRPARFAGTRDSRHSSRRAISRDKDRHTHRTDSPLQARIN